MKLIREGKSRTVIIQELKEKYPNEKSYQYPAWYSRGVMEIATADDKYTEKLREIQRERLENIMSGAIGKKDYLSAVKAVETMNKMFGINEQKQVVEIKEHSISFDFGNINNDEEDDNN